MKSLLVALPVPSAAVTNSKKREERNEKKRKVHIRLELITVSSHTQQPIHDRQHHQLLSRENDGNNLKSVRRNEVVSSEFIFPLQLLS